MEGRWKVGFFDCIPSVQRTTSEQLEGVLREQKEREGEVSQLKASLEQGVQDCKTQLYVCPLVFCDNCTSLAGRLANLRPRS